MADIAKYQVDVTEIVDSLDRMDQIPRYVINQTVNEIKLAARDLLTEIFTLAMEQQDDLSFDEDFRTHLIGVVNRAEINSAISGSTFEVDFDFDTLGTTKDLERAFHQGARLADGTRLDGPYEGQALAQEDPESRHIYWRAIRLGLARAENPDGPGTVPIPEGYNWDRTKAKYIEIWGDKAPLWIYLEYGQDAWDTTIESYPVIEEFTERFEQAAAEIFETNISEAIAQAEEAEIELTKYGARDITTGRFTSLRR